MEHREIEEWYDQNKAKYEDFIQVLEGLIKTLLQAECIPYHSVGGRLKERSSCVEKFGRKSYNTPEQMMDIAGLRIITHTTAEVEQVCEVIKREFEVDEENSENKAQNMGVDKVGYLSVHYVVRMASGRLKLKEYERFADLCCEIQVRSLLQHAWAEIEHDRSYKFAGVLPIELQRRFYLIAGTLELMDQEFRALSCKIDEYANHVNEETKKGNLDIPIDSTSLLQFLNEFFKGQPLEKLVIYYQERSNEIIEELRDFGVETLQQLNDLLNKMPAAEWVLEKDNVRFIGILRNAMIINDPQKYFERCWKEHWEYTDAATMNYWKQHGVDLTNIVEFEKFNGGGNDYFILKR